MALLAVPASLTTLALGVLAPAALLLLDRRPRTR
jgi:hypothetical protein